MAKHPLLPHDYKDSLTHAAILFALKPYEVKGSRDVNNPQGRWNLNNAWNAARELLPHIHWNYNESLAFDEETAEYLFPAYNEHDIEQANVLIAGLVACQILSPEKEIVVRRIVHRKGGEMDLVISHQVAQRLKDMFPDMTLAGGAQEEANNTPVMKRILGYLRIGRK